MTARAGGFLPFVAFAILLHVAAFGIARSGGEAAAGAGGSAPVTLRGGDPALAALVVEWQRPPVTSVAAAKLPTSMPVRAAKAAPELALRPLPGVTPAAPESPITPPSAPVVHATPEPRPLARPDRLEARRRPPAEQDQQAVVRRAAPEPAVTVAAGTGGTAVAGASGRAEATTGEERTAARARAVWGAALQHALQRGLVIAPGLRTRREIRVLLDLEISPEGRVLRAEIARSSGRPDIDRAVLSAVARAGRLPRAPEELTAPVYPFEVPIVFEPA
jgi:protein TonB